MFNGRAHFHAKNPRLGYDMLMARQFPELLIDGPKHASTTIVLAHGAGAGMDTPFMNFFAQGLANKGAACGSP